MKNIQVQELKDIIDSNTDIQIIDVRSLPEFEDARIDSEKVQNIEINEILSKKDLINKNKGIYLICASGGRSSVAQVLLMSVGITATNVLGGMNAWISKGYPIKSA